MFDAAHLALTVFTSAVHFKEAKLLCYSMHRYFSILQCIHSGSVYTPCMVQPIGLVGLYMSQEKRWRIPNMM